MKYTIMIFLIALLVFSGCKKTGEVQETTQDATDSEAESAPEESIEETEDSASIFKQFAMKKSALSFQVVYDVATTSGGKSMRTMMGQFIKGKQLRTDITAEGVETRMYFSEGKINTCMNQGSWSCFSMVEQQGKAYDESVKDIESNPEQYDIQKLPNRALAGTTATCFRIKSEGTVDYCLSPEGVPLYMKSEGEGYTSEMTAKSYSLSVPGSAFELPAEPQDFGALGNFDPSKFQQS